MILAPFLGNDPGDVVDNPLKFSAPFGFRVILRQTNLEGEVKISSHLPKDGCSRKHFQDVWWQMSREPSDNMLPVENAVSQLFEVDLGLQLVV